MNEARIAQLQGNTNRTAAENVELNNLIAANANPPVPSNPYPSDTSANRSYGTNAPAKSLNDTTLKTNEARIAVLKSNTTRTAAEEAELRRLEGGLEVERKLSQARAGWRTQANAILDNLNENEWSAIVELLRSRGFAGFLTSYPNGTYGAPRGSDPRASIAIDGTVTSPGAPYDSNAPYAGQVRNSPFDSNYPNRP